MSISLHKRRVGANLRMAIEALGLSQAKIARDFGVSPPKLGNWLRGDHYPDPWFVLRFCERHGVTADWIYRGKVLGLAQPLADDLWAAAQASEAEPMATDALAPKMDASVSPSKDHG